MKLEHISKSYLLHNHHRVKALQDVSLDFENQGLVVILGSSGCGKTTLLNIISGLDQDYRGRIEDPLESEYINQDFRLFESLTIIENLKLVSDNLDKITDYLQLFELVDQTHSKVKKLSNGQKRRVQVIRSLLMERELLLCDEPTAAMDPLMAKLIMEELKKYAVSHLVIVVTHDIALAEAYADRLIQIEAGKIISDTKIHETFPLCRQEVKKAQHSRKAHWWVTMTYLYSRLGNYALTCLLIVIALIMTYASFSVFITIRHETSEKIVFRNHENLIVSQPVDEKVSIHYQMYYTSYDRYTLQQIRLLTDNIPEIIAVQMYSGGDKAYLPRNAEGAAVWRMDEASYDAFLEREFVYMDTVFYEYERWISFNGQRELTSFPDRIASNPFFVNDVRLGWEKRQIVFYDLVNDYCPNLLYGTVPENDNEIIVSINFAEYLQAYYHLSSLNDLVGRTIHLGVYKESQMQVDAEESFERIPVVVTGITSLDFKADEHVIFFNHGLARNVLMEHLVKNIDRFEAETVKILIDTQSDIEAVTKQINEIIEPNRSRFVEYTLSREAEEGYRSLTTLFFYLTILEIFIIIIYTFVQMTQRHRNVKEYQLFQTYGYSAQRLIRQKVFMLFGVTGIIYVFLIVTISPLINSVAMNWNYVAFMRLDILWLLSVYAFLLTIWLIIHRIAKG